MIKILKDIRQIINVKKSYTLMDMNKRQIKEIFKKKMEVQEQYLKADREEKDTRILEAKLNVLNWVLGDDTSI